MYELGEGTHTVRELIGRAEGLREDAFRGRALLFRERDDLTPEIVAVDLEGVLSGRLTDISLRRNDVLVVSSVHDLEDRGGSRSAARLLVREFIPMRRIRRSRISSCRPGGLLDGASTVKVEVSRRLEGPEEHDPLERVGKVYAFSLKEGLVVDGEAGFELAPFDVVEVRRSRLPAPQRQVVLDREVVLRGITR